MIIIIFPIFPNILYTLKVIYEKIQSHTKKNVLSGIRC